MDIFRVIKTHGDASRDWLAKEAKASQLRECKNDRFAAITHRQEGKSNAEKERLARLDPEWVEYRTGMLEAEDQARRARLWMKQQQMIFDGMRTVNANARKELDIQGLMP